MFFNRVQYTGSRLTDKTYSVTLAANAQAAPEGEVFHAIIESSPKSAAYFSCLGSVTGGVFTVLSVLDSSLSANTIPAFVNVTIACAPSEYEKRIASGRGVVSLWGQSNMIALNEGEDVEIDHIYSNVLQWKRSKSAVTTFAEPLEHQSIQATRPDTPVSYARGFSNKLIDNGFKTIINVPSAWDGTGFVTTNGWAVGNAISNTAIQDLIDCLNEDPANFPLCGLMRMGETDSINNMSQTVWRDHIVALIQHTRTTVEAATGHDMSTWPFILIGMNTDFLAGTHGAKAAAVEAAMAEAATMLPFVYHLSIDGWSVSRGDDTHDDLATARRVGNQELIPALRAAMGNAPSADVTHQITASFISSGTFTVSNFIMPPQITASMTGSGTLTAEVRVPAQITASMTGTGTFTANVQEGASTEAPVPVFLLQKGVEQTPSTGIMDSWGSTQGSEQIENFTTFFKGSTSSGSLNLAGNSLYNFSAGMGTLAFNDTSGCTIIIDVTPDLAAPADNIINTADALRITAAGDLTKIQGTDLVWSGFATGSRQWAAFTIDRANDFAKVFLDNVEDTVVNGLAVLQTTGNSVGDQQVGGTAGAYDGLLHNMYIYNGPMNMAQCLDAVNTYFIT